MQPDLKKAADTFHRAINILDTDEEIQLGQLLAATHRTLQQGSMRVFISFLRVLAEAHDAHYYDLRNEAAVKLAKKIITTINPEDLQLPLI